MEAGLSSDQHHVVLFGVAGSGFATCSSLLLRGGHFVEGALSGGRCVGVGDDSWLLGRWRW